MTSAHIVNVADLTDTEQEAMIVKILAESVAASVPMDNPWTYRNAMRLAERVRETGYTGSLTLSEQFASADSAAALYGVVWHLDKDLTFTCHF